MKHTIRFLAGVLALGLLSACGGGAVSDLGAASLALAQDEIGVIAVTTTAGDESPVAEISLADGSVSSDTSSVGISGSDVTINSGGSYRLLGTLSDGVVVVDAGDTETVRLLFDGVDVTNLRGPALEIAGAKSVVIELVSGASNHLVDGAGSSAKAVISSTADLKIIGDGDLTIRANSGDGISVEAGLAITGGTIDVMAHGDGITAVDYIVLGAPDLTINSDGAGIMSTMTGDPDLGYISIAGGSYTIDASGDAITAGSDLYIYAGEFEVTTGGASVTAGRTGAALP